MKELTDAVGTEFLQRLGRLNNRPFPLQMGFRIKLVGIANNLLLKCVRLIDTVWVKGQASFDNLLARQSCSGMALTHLGMKEESLLAKQLSAYHAVPDIGFCAEALDAWGVALEDADVVKHGCLLKKCLVELQFRMGLGNLQTAVGHAAAMS